MHGPSPVSAADRAMLHAHSTTQFSKQIESICYLQFGRTPSPNVVLLRN